MNLSNKLGDLFESMLIGPCQRGLSRHISDGLNSYLTDEIWFSIDDDPKGLVQGSVKEASLNRGALG